MSLFALCTVAQHACPFPPNPKRAIKQPSTVAAALQALDANARSYLDAAFG